MTSLEDKPLGLSLGALYLDDTALYSIVCRNNSQEPLSLPASVGPVWLTTRWLRYFPTPPGATAEVQPPPAPGDELPIRGIELPPGGHVQLVLRANHFRPAHFSGYINVGEEREVLLMAEQEPVLFHAGWCAVVICACFHLATCMSVFWGAVSFGLLAAVMFALSPRVFSQPLDWLMAKFFGKSDAAIYEFLFGKSIADSSRRLLMCLVGATVVFLLASGIGYASASLLAVTGAFGLVVYAPALTLGLGMWVNLFGHNPLLMLGRLIGGRRAAKGG